MSLTQLVPPAWQTLSGQQNVAKDYGKRFLGGKLFATTSPSGEEFINELGLSDTFPRNMITLRNRVVFPLATLHPGAIIYKSGVHYGSNGSSWNALY